MINAWVPCEGAIRWREAGLRKLRWLVDSTLRCVGRVGKAVTVPSLVISWISNHICTLQPECRKSLSRGDWLIISDYPAFNNEKPLNNFLVLCNVKKTKNLPQRITMVLSSSTQKFGAAEKRFFATFAVRKLIFLPVQLFCKLYPTSLIGPAFLCFPVNTDFDSFANFYTNFLGSLPSCVCQRVKDLP